MGFSRCLLRSGFIIGALLGDSRTPQAIETLDPLPPPSESSEGLTNASPSLPEPNASSVTPAGSETTPSIRVTNLVIKGNLRVDRQSILDYFQSKPDHLYSPQDLDQYLKALYNTGLFADVSLDIKDSSLHVTVSENLCLKRIVFEGNRAVSDSDLRTELGLTPGKFYTPTSLQEATLKILRIYSAKGYYCARVTPKTVVDDTPGHNNRVNLVFEIQEGSKAYIRNLYFIGNKNVTNSTLKDVVSSREIRWYHFLPVQEGFYDSARVHYDGELIRQFYAALGYVDFRLLSTHSELSPDRSAFLITFKMEEGARYRFNKSNIISEVPDIDTQSLLKDLPWKEGDWFNGKIVQDIAEKMGQRLNNLGHPFIEVVPDLEKDAATTTVKVTYRIRPTPPVYINAINVKGHGVTNEDVIRRELRFKEGDPVSPNKFTISEKALQALNFFETAEITHSPSSQDGFEDITVSVKEKSTADIQLMGGYSSVDGIGGKASYTERNFLGRGQALSIQASGNRRGFEGDAGINLPYFMGRPIVAGGQLFGAYFRGDTRGTFAESGGWRQHRFGGAFSINYILRPNMTQGWKYSVAQDHITLNDKNTPHRSPYLVKNIHDQPTQYLSSLTHDIMYSRLETIANEPVGGFYGKMMNQFVGLGGTVHFFLNRFIFNAYKSLEETHQWMLRLELRYGFIQKLGYMRFADQFYLGGSTFPGFQESGVGPRDIGTTDALGGTQYYTAALKCDFPLIGLPPELPIKGVAFIQSGSLWSSIFEGPGISSNNFGHRASTGIGIIANLPLVGRVGLLYNYLLQKQPGDQGQTWYIVWGQDF